jgi:hypothetical protein
MDAVPDPVLGGGALAGVVEDRLETDHSGMIFGGEAGDGLPALLDGGGPFVEVLLMLAGGEGKGFAGDEAEARVGGHGSGEEPVVGLLEFIERHLAAGVVDADDDAELPLMPRLRKVRLRSGSMAPNLAAMRKA